MGKFFYYFFQNKFLESSRDLQNDAFRYIDTAKNMTNIDSFQKLTLRYNKSVRSIFMNDCKDDFKDTFTM